MMGVQRRCLAWSINRYFAIFTLSIITIMKKILYILFVFPFFFGCNPEENNGGGQSNDFWMFELTINGETYKAEGYGYNSALSSTNFSICNNWDIGIGIMDPTSDTYISGNNGSIIIDISNPSLGIVLCDVYGGWFDEAVSASNARFFQGYSLSQGGTMEPDSQGDIGVNLPITFTDLGTAGNGQFVGGTSIKGSYSGTIYLPSYNADPFSPEYSIPMTIDIQFEALRI